MTVFQTVVGSPILPSRTIMKKITIIIFVTMVLMGGYFAYIKTDKIENMEVATPLVYKDLVKILNLKANDTVTSTFVVMGEARGYWYFEASFPIELWSKDGKILASGIGQAQGEWMTENFVPFKTTLTVGLDYNGSPMGGATSSYSGPATLILHKDNPSGLPENEDSFEVPIFMK